MFLSLTEGLAPQEQRKTAVKVIVAVLTAAAVLFFAGEWIFRLFGITLDSFRIGAGALLFLNAVDLVRGPSHKHDESDDGIAVVPLAIPITIGPATTGAILVFGAEAVSLWDRVFGLGALATAVLVVGCMLLGAAAIEKLVGRRGLLILSKVTGLVLSALAAQLIFTGVKNFLG